MTLALALGFSTGVVVLLFADSLDTLGQGDILSGVFTGLPVVLVFCARPTAPTPRQASGGE